MIHVISTWKIRGNDRDPLAIPIAQTPVPWMSSALMIQRFHENHGPTGLKSRSVAPTGVTIVALQTPYKIYKRDQKLHKRH